MVTMNAATAATSSKTTLEMLGEIGNGTAQQLVTGVRYASTLYYYSPAPPGPTFVPMLDEILGQTRPHPGGSTLQRGDLIELIGPSGSGKTTLLCFFLTTTLLPSSIEIPLPAPGAHLVDVPTGGSGSHAYCLQPTSHPPIIDRIRTKMRAHLEDCILDTLSTNLRPRIITPPLAAAINRTITQALSRLSIIRFKPRWKYLYMSLMRVLHPPALSLGPPVVIEEVKKQSAGMVVIDGFGDPYWPERWSEEDKRVKRASMGISSGENIGMKDILRLVQALRERMGTLVFLSVQGLWSKSSSPFFMPHLPRPYPSPFNATQDDDEGSQQPGRFPLNIQITLLGRVRPLQLPADLTLIDAMRDQAEKDWSKAQHFEGIVRVLGGHELAGTLAGARFQWKSGANGVEVWNEP